jgi:hypothetical protein
LLDLYYTASYVTPNTIWQVKSALYSIRWHLYITQAGLRAIRNQKL